MRSLLNKGGRDVMVDQTDTKSPAPSPTSASASAPKAAKAAPRRFSIMSATASASDLEKSRYANFKRALLALPPSDTMRLMHEGRDFYVWTVDDATGRVFRQMQHVYFVSAASQSQPEADADAADPALKLGSLYWNAVGRKENDPKRRLLISQLTDVYVGTYCCTPTPTPCHAALDLDSLNDLTWTRRSSFSRSSLFCFFVLSASFVCGRVSAAPAFLPTGKQTAVLADPAAAGANAKCCVTLATSTGQQLNLESMTAESANSFLSGINSVLTGNGMQVVLEDAKTAGETTSGKALVANGGAAVPGPGLPGSSRAAKRFSILGAPSLPGVNMSDPRAVAIANADGVAGVAGSASSAGKQRTVLGVATHEAVAAMAEGRRFTRYSIDRSGKAAKQTVTLFYVKDLHGQRSMAGWLAGWMDPLRLG